MQKHAILDQVILDPYETMNLFAFWFLSFRGLHWFLGSNRCYFYLMWSKLRLTTWVKITVGIKEVMLMINKSIWCELCSNCLTGYFTELYQSISMVFDITDIAMNQPACCQPVEYPYGWVVMVLAPLDDCLASKPAEAVGARMLQYNTM